MEEEKNFKQRTEEAMQALNTLSPKDDFMFLAEDDKKRIIIARMSDIALMGFLEVIRRERPEVFEAYEVFRAMIQKEDAVNEKH